MSRPRPRPVGLWSADFFVMRTPYLPADAVLAIDGPSPGDVTDSVARAAEPSTAAGAVDGDRPDIRERLRRLASRTDVQEALRLASPAFAERVAAWRGVPASDGKQRQQRQQTDESSAAC